MAHSAVIPPAGSFPRFRKASSTSSRIRGGFKPHFNGRTVIDTEEALLVHRRDHPLRYIFPENVITGLPTEPEPEVPGYVHVQWDSVDSWFEEGRRLVHYPPNPYHRVDCRPTNRRLRVTMNDTFWSTRITPS